MKHYDAPRQTEETAPVRIINTFTGIVCIIGAFGFANWVAHQIGEPGSILVVFWATVLLGMWMCGEGIVAFVRWVSRP